MINRLFDKKGPKDVKTVQDENPEPEVSTSSDEVTAMVVEVDSPTEVEVTLNSPGTGYSKPVEEEPEKPTEVLLAGYWDIPDKPGNKPTRRKMEIVDCGGKAAILVSNKLVSITSEKTVKDYVSGRFDSKYFGEYKATRRNNIPDKILELSLDIQLRTRD